MILDVWISTYSKKKSTAGLLLLGSARGRNLGLLFSVKTLYQTFFPEGWFRVSQICVEGVEEENLSAGTMKV